MCKTAKNYANETLKVRKVRNQNVWRIYVTKRVTGETRQAHDDFYCANDFNDREGAESYLQVNALVLA